VFKNAASPEQLAEAEEIFWNSTEKLYPEVKRDNPSSWTNDNWPCMMVTTTGVVSNDSSGHSPFMWYVRGLPKIKQAFSSVWQEENLLVSFDGYGAFRPPEIFGPTRSGWYHLDQNGYQKPGRHCVQGFLNVYPCGVDDGGLVVVPGSHIQFGHWFNDRLITKKKGDFVMLCDYPLKQMFGSLNPVKLCVDPGDFVMWDSRTVHCSHPAKPFPEKPITRLRRLVAYVCMTPSSRAAKLKELRNQRLEAFSAGITLNHWPHEYHPHPTDHSDKKGLHCVYKPISLNEHQQKLLEGI